jgi:uncharacterized protein
MDYSIVAKVTENCNANCKYCYLDKTKNLEMNEEVAERLIQELLTVNETFAHFTWIGGEPLLKPISFFEKIAEYTQKHNHKNIRVSHSIQTNGILLDKERFETLKNLGFKIGVSYDGTRELEEERVGIRNAQIVLENIEREKGKLGIISVLTKKSFGKEREMYDFFRRNTTFARVNFYAPTGRGSEFTDEFLPSKEEAKSMLLKFYDLWLNDQSRLELRPHREITRSFFTGLSLNCEYSAVSCYRIFGSDSQGDIYTCSRATHLPEMKLGNISEGLNSFIGGDIHSKPLVRYLSLKEKNMDPWVQLSSGGCPIEALSHKGDYSSPTYYSGEIRNSLFDKIAEDIKDDRKRKTLERKAGLN